MKKRGYSAPLTDEEMDESFSRVDLDGDQTSVTKEGKGQG